MFLKFELRKNYFYGIIIYMYMYIYLKFNLFYVVICINFIGKEFYYRLGYIN